MENESIWLRNATINNNYYYHHYYHYYYHHHHYNYHYYHHNTISAIPWLLQQYPG